MHRISCFRDDVIFVVYLYQRYYYKVDKTRGVYATERKPTSDSIEEQKSTEETKDAITSSTSKVEDESKKDRWISKSDISLTG